MSEVERQFHDSFKPTWGPGNVLVHAAHSDVSQYPQSQQAPFLDVVGSLASEHQDIRFSKFAASNEVRFWKHLLGL